MELEQLDLRALLAPLVLPALLVLEPRGRQAPRVKPGRLARLGLQVPVLRGRQVLPAGQVLTVPLARLEQLV